jgi:hypothetical protein
MRYSPHVDDFVYDQDPTGGKLIISALNSAYVRLSVDDPDRELVADILITPQALRDAAAAAEDMTS